MIVSEHLSKHRKWCILFMQSLLRRDCASTATATAGHGVHREAFGRPVVQRVRMMEAQ